MIIDRINQWLQYENEWNWICNDLNNIYLKAK